MGVDCGDVVVLPLRFLAELPLPSTLTAQSVGDGGDVVVLTSSRARYAQLVTEGVAVYSPTEYEAIAEGIEQGRVTRVDVDRWSKLKRETPGGYRVARATVWGGEPPRAIETAPEGLVWRGSAQGEGEWSARGLTVGQWLRWCGLELVSIAIEAAERRAAA